MGQLLLIAPAHPMRIWIDDPYDEMLASDMFFLIKELKDIKWSRIKIGDIEGYIVREDDNIRELEAIPASREQSQNSHTP